MKSLVRKWLMGNTVFSEYSKITSADDPQQKVWMKSNEKITDVSSTHWLLCIEPLIFGIWLDKDTSNTPHPLKEECNIYFGGYKDSEKNKIRDPETELSLNLFDCILCLDYLTLMHNC